jgi:hypothetical protein
LPLEVSVPLDPDAPGVVDEPELGGVVVEAPLEELPLPVVDFEAEPSVLLPDAPGAVDEPDEPEVPSEEPLGDFEDGLVDIDEEPEPPDGGVAVELRGVVPELPEVPLEPLLSPQPTSASVLSTTPARSVRLSIESSPTIKFKRRRIPMPCGRRHTISKTTVSERNSVAMLGQS